MADLALATAPAADVPRNKPPRRRPTKENLISMQNLLSGTDEYGIRIRIFTAGQQRQRCRITGVSEYKYEGGTVPCEEEGLRLPGKHRHGHGEMSDEVGNKYVGEWANDKRSGKGTYTFACGDTYEGEWLNGMYHGHGKYSSNESDEYEGQWKEDKMSGHGKYRYRELGDVYEGDWEGGFREGFGKYTCADGTVFIGQYEAGELMKKLKIDAADYKAGTDANGKRLMFMSATQTCHRARDCGLDKFIYEGETLDSDQEGLKMPGKARHGEGEIRYESGSTYTGQWERDKRAGKGKFTFACGDVYEGEWKENKYHGHGKYSSADTDEYEGQWKEDKMHGQGRYFFRVSGDVHEVCRPPQPRLPLPDPAHTAWPPGSRGRRLLTADVQRWCAAPG